MKSLTNYTNKAREALTKYAAIITDPAYGTTEPKLHVIISRGNSKIGAIQSVSILPIMTCPAVCGKTCAHDCYAAKLANFRPSVLDSYALNTAILLHDPETYWQDVENAIAAARYFRFHVAGDIYGIPYFEHMVTLARKYPYCEILAFTKAFNTVNKYIAENGDLPNNLHILFSGWTNLKPLNPYNLPETNIITKDMDTIPDTWKICGGSCQDCICRGLGCWQAQKGDIIAFHKH